MRVEATIPENRGAAMAELAAELGMSRSQVVDEALALFLKAVVEVRKGRRLVTLDPNRHEAVCELATPTLSALEWASMKRTSLALPADAVERMHALVEAPPEPTAKLKAAMKRNRR